MMIVKLCIQSFMTMFGLLEFKVALTSVADTVCDTPPRHTIQTQGRSVFMLSIDVEDRSGIHNYQFYCLDWHLT